MLTPTPQGNFDKPDATTLAGRMRLAMGKAGKTNQSELAREIGIKPQAIQYLLEPKNNATGSRHIAAFAFALGVNSVWLATGEGDMTPAGSDMAAPALNPTSAPGDAVLLVPLLANAGSMGCGNDVLCTDVIVGNLALSPHWINQHIKPANPQELRFIHAHGESMAPTFTDGDVLLVDVGSRDPSSFEGVYVLEVRQKVYIKRVRMRMDGQLEVSSDNTTIKTVDVLNGDHEVNVLGRVVWAWNGRKL